MEGEAYGGDTKPESEDAGRETLEDSRSRVYLPSHESPMEAGPEC